MNQHSLFHKREVRSFPRIQNNLIHKDTATLQLLLKSSGSSGSMIIVLSGGKVKKPVLNASP